jgi:hypothetical protein
MKHLPLTLLFLAAITFYACDPTPHDNDNDDDPLTAEDGTPKYKDHEIDSMTIRVDESAKRLDQEIRVAQDEVDSLLEGI